MQDLRAFLLLYKAFWLAYKVLNLNIPNILQLAPSPTLERYIVSDGFLFIYSSQICCLSEVILWGKINRNASNRFKELSFSLGPAHICTIDSKPQIRVFH